mmetsp:Transcript_57838/g.183387  ORF Transcript_57838/g.183387 Transcript_57838/m.183387 type:complete len:100 (-) Transcript_57838:1421-1720(-)
MKSISLLTSNGGGGGGGGGGIASSPMRARDGAGKAGTPRRDSNATAIMGLFDKASHVMSNRSHGPRIKTGGPGARVKDSGGLSTPTLHRMKRDSREDMP